MFLKVKKNRKVKDCEKINQYRRKGKEERI